MAERADIIKIDINDGISVIVIVKCGEIITIAYATELIAINLLNLAVQVKYSTNL